MASAGQSRAKSSASATQARPIPVRWRPGSTAIDSRYTGRATGVKYLRSIAHGFRVASVSVAAMSRSSRTTKTDARRMLARTPFSVMTDDQWTMPCRAVSSAATAFCSAAIADASAASAIVSRPRCPNDGDYRRRVPRSPRSEDEPESYLRLPWESPAAPQIRQHEERRREPAVRIGRRRVVEVRSVGDVEDVQEHLQRLLPSDLASPPCP